jgi:Carboxypeptidase regulatory-like domain/TonB-dependent Receptor Plug Domain
MTKTQRAAALLLAGLTALSALPASAQVTTGTIVGTVKDSAGAVVPGATVTITETGKQTASAYTTDGEGAYTAPFLIPGTYELAVDMQGFRKYVRRGVVLQVNQRARVDITLEVGTFAEATEVTALAPLTRSDSAEMGDVIEERAIRELPLNGRNFATLVYLTPGVTAGQIGENLSGASTFNPRGASNFNALGSQANANAWLIDGIDNNEYTFNTVIVTPSVESVREFKVLTGTFSAEFGRGAGVVSVSTKSGSNEIHGTAFEYLRNDAFDARNFFARGDLPKPPLDRHQYGGSLSGPIIRNRTFFFVDYAGLNETRGLTFVNTVPTDKTRRGDFSDYRTPAGALIPIYDPLTTRPNPNGPGLIRDPFPGNVIPSNRLNQVGLNVASIYPLPNGPGNFDNYTSTANREVKDNAFTARIDHKAGARDSFFVRYSYDNYKLDAPQGQAACCLPTPDFASRFDLGPFVAGIQNTRLTTHGAALNWSHIFGPTVVNELRLGFAKTNPETRQSDFGHQSASSLGIQGINVTEFTTGLPNLNIQDVTGISGGPAFLPVNPKQTHYQLEDSLALVRGRHSLKTGYRFILRKPSPFTNTDTRSSISVNRNLTNNPATNSQGSGLATLVLGYTTGGARGFLLEPYDMTNVEHSLFVQDDWKVSSRLTANVGLRYEVYGADTEKEDRLVNFDPVALKLIYAGEDGVSRTVNKKTRHNLAPRLGLAWDVSGDSKNVVRAGYGISYYPLAQSASNLLGQQVPYTISQNYSVETNPSDFSRVPLISNPFPPIAQVKPRTTAELNAANPRILGHGFENETPSMRTWQVSYERQLTQTLMAEIAYVGSKGTHLVVCYNPNEVQPGPGSQASRRLLQPLSNVSTIVQCDPRNKSNYNSLQGKLLKRFSGGLQFLASYTFGKSLDFGASAASGGGAVGNGQTVTRMDLWRGPSGFDVKHRFVLSSVWDLPFGSGRRWASGGVGDAILGHWQLSGIVTVATGRPFTVFLNTGVNNGAPSWPNRIGSGTLDNPTADLWFDVTAFAAPPPNTYGDSGRGILYAPGQRTIDISLAKRIPIRQRLNLQLRADAFNLLNSPQLGFPNANIGSPTAGRITTTVGDNRQMQFAAKVDW